MINDLNVYQLNIGGEQEWLLAETNIHALKMYYKMTGIGLADGEDQLENEDDIIELSDDCCKNVPWRDEEFSDEENKDLNLYTYIIKNQEHFQLPTYLGTSCQ